MTKDKCKTCVYETRCFPLLKLGQAHMAQDLLPQFTELCKKVDLNYEVTLAAQGVSNEAMRRVVTIEESIEALSETVDQLSTCKCEAGNQMLKRISELERAVYNSPFSKIVMEEYAERIGNIETRMDCVTKGDLVLIAEHVDNLEESNRVFLKSIPDIEILKTQMQGVEEKLITSPFFDVVLQECVDRIKELAICVDVLQRQQNNTSIRQNGLINEYLEQKRFLAKVQVILDRERDDRLVNSPSHKKELEALKQEADMLVKKGRPRK